MSNVVTSFFKSYTFKFMVIGVLSLLLLIPSAMIRKVIMERASRNESVMMEIADKWSLAQTITGPYIDIPTERVVTEQKEEVVLHNIFHMLPESLDIVSTVDPIKKKRGIFQAVVYNSRITLKGRFNLESDELHSIFKNNIHTGRAYLNIGLSDLRGIGNLSSIRINGEVANILPGAFSTEVTDKGIHVDLDPAILENANSLEYEIILDLKGSADISFTPVGKLTSATMESPWPDPSFMGNFLPSEKQITDDGFTATWNINYLNRNYPQEWYNREQSTDYSEFGVHFLIPVDHYQKSERSVKYAFMFIALTFLVFFLTEVISRKRIHPIQYLLVGFALVIFYTLLVSLSEQLGFNVAYLISTAAVTLLVSFYIRSGTSSTRVGILTGLLLLLLYGYLFSILQLQELSLLMGSIGLFIVLGIIMFVSRKINWYKEESNETT